MTLQDLALWAIVLGVPLAIISLIIAYMNLKGKGQIKINYNITVYAMKDSQIYQEYKKGVEEEREDE
jgi:predicted transposase YdaD